METITSCGISDATEFHTLWRLPKLPLTERFGPYRQDHGDLAFDQELVISIPTGHVQLRHQLDPRLLYTSSEYSFRTTASESARSGTAFFVDFLHRVAPGRQFKSLCDVGGNDLFLAKALSGVARHRAVVDPICTAVDGQTLEGVKVFGRFIQDVDLGVDMPQPDILVCRHTLEHIASPRDVIRQWFRQCDPECLYLVEIPCFANLVEAQRFDAIFHQHFQYYDLPAFRRLIWECGGEYVQHAFNHQGSCGGALLVAFRRATSNQTRPELDLVKRIKYFEHRIANYRKQMEVLGDLLRELPDPVYGYGASLMLATLGYQLGTDFASLNCVLDDDPAKDGTTYENIPVKVRATAMARPAPDASYVVTSLENVRPIFKRIIGLVPRRVLVPSLS